jgi:hypothetical protein
MTAAASTGPRLFRRIPTPPIRTKSYGVDTADLIEAS